MNKLNPIESECCKIPKGWGHELILVNNEKYCGKILFFKKGCKFSMHYHMIKQETWYVQEGYLLFSWIDTEVGQTLTKMIGKGDVVTIPVGLPHQLCAQSDAEIIEISTQHFDYDSFRIHKGD
jgi:mannose-6-phosphate isomerase-like protein (cupin superfamily)